MKFTKAYVARLANDGYVKIDQDEILKVAKAMDEKRTVILRNGIINPSYCIGIMEDRERVREWHDDCNRGFDQGNRAKEEGMKPLRNIFEGTELEKVMIANKNNHPLPQVLL